ncbi:hypothetical protein [Streptomyces sp. NPDC048106]
MALITIAAGEFRRHGVGRVFPGLGEAATTAEIIDMLEVTR